VTMLQREGRLSPLGEAIASYGRIFKTLHILAAATEESYRRDIKGLRNLQDEPPRRVRRLRFEETYAISFP
jgi:TnpA family transposase